MEYCSQYDCKEILEKKHTCELCNKNFCNNCIYLICTICHKRFTCFHCGSQDRNYGFITGYCKVKSPITGFIACSKHIDKKYEERKCEEENCIVCK